LLLHIRAKTEFCAGKQLAACKAAAAKIGKMPLAMVDDIRVIIVKLADRLHNMRALGHLSAERRAHVATETIEIYAPLRTA
jgi:(p)ppGpp synthase/HD superfamily hydrolase